MLKFKEFIGDPTDTIEEGGGFGHLNNPHDVNLTFAEMNTFIRDVLHGHLDYVEEKTDATNLMISYRSDKGIMAARNKGHLKNFGENALSIAGIGLKFKGRELEFAYTKAMENLEAGINALSAKQVNKIFAEGRKWLSIEVMGHGSENIIEYGVKELRLHGTIEHNEAGEKVDAIDKGAAKILDGMLRQRGAHEQSEFTIRNLNRVKLPKVDQFDQMEKKFKGQLQKIMRQWKMRGNNTISDYRAAVWTKEINAQTRDKNLRNLLIQRWAYFTKQPSISKIKKDYPNDAGWISALEKQAQHINKQASLPFEKLFLGLGAERLKTMSEFMAMNPSHTVKKLKAKIDHAVGAIKKSGNVELLNKLELELSRLEATGKLMPTEGITFFWKGHFLKLTGSFAPANQIVGMMFRL